MHISDPIEPPAPVIQITEFINCLFCSSKLLIDICLPSRLLISIFFNFLRLKSPLIKFLKEGISNTLPLHDINDDEDYFLGVF